MAADRADPTPIPCSGTAPAVTGVLGGQVAMLCDQTTQTIAQIKAQKVKFYGVTTKHRINALPDAPTLDEQGLKDFEVIVWHGVYAPKGTPREALERLNVALRAALRDPDVASKFTELWAQVCQESKQAPAGVRGWLRAQSDKAQ